MVDVCCVCFELCLNLGSCIGGFDNCDCSSYDKNTNTTVYKAANKNSPSQIPIAVAYPIQEMNRDVNIQF
jgi:hypothetical protein